VVEADGSYNDVLTSSMRTILTLAFGEGKTTSVHFSKVTSHITDIK